MEKHIIHTIEQSGEGVLDAPVPMVERAFQLLDLLMASDNGLTLSDLARTLSMSKGSMHRLLKTLENCGVIELRDNRLYVLGPRIYKLATFVRGTGIRRLALPAMQRLASHVGETTFLGRFEQEEVHVIESVEAGGQHLFPHVSVPRGTHIPLPAGASARIVLASWPIERVRAWLRTHPLPRYTEHSITDPEQFLNTIEEVARTGFAFDNEEYLIGVNAVAVPIYGPERSLLAQLCMLGFAAHFNGETLLSAGQQLQEEAATIARALGTDGRPQGSS